MVSRTIEVSVRGGSEQEIARQETMKFVVADDDQIRRVVLSKNDQVPPHEDKQACIGDGTVYHRGDRFDVHWGSKCPADATEAQQTLGEVTQAIRLWIQKATNTVILG